MLSAFSPFFMNHPSALAFFIHIFCGLKDFFFSLSSFCSQKLSFLNVLIFFWVQPLLKVYFQSFHRSYIDEGGLESYDDEDKFILK